MNCPGCCNSEKWILKESRQDVEIVGGACQTVICKKQVCAHCGFVALYELGPGIEVFDGGSDGNKQ
jgi:hypothetical protein